MKSDSFWIKQRAVSSRFSSCDDIFLGWMTKSREHADDLRRRNTENTASMACATKGLIVTTAVVVNLLFIFPSEAASGQKSEGSPVESNQLSAIKLYQNKNGTQTEHKKLIGGVEPGAFYAGVVLLVLLLVCFILCSCLSGSRTTTATVNESPRKEDQNIQNTREGDLTEVKVNLEHGEIQHTNSCVDNEGFATSADTSDEKNDNPEEITVELKQVRVESEDFVETKETELEKSCQENEGFTDEVQT